MGLFATSFQVSPWSRNSRICCVEAAWAVHRVAGDAGPLELLADALQWTPSSAPIWRRPSPGRTSRPQA